MDITLKLLKLKCRRGKEEDMKRTPRSFAYIVLSLPNMIVVYVGLLSRFQFNLHSRLYVNHARNSLEVINVIVNGSTNLTLSDISANDLLLF